jgi:glycosyltransferase involved in cell wall biosynthesis
MKIAIDVQTILGQKTGFGFYVNNLTQNLKAIDKKNEYFLLKPKTDKDLSAPQRLLWDQIDVPNLARKNHVDILHQPCFSAPIIHSNMKVVVTIHDLIAILYGQDIPFFSRQFFGRWMPFSYKFADRIIAISNHTKKDIIKFLHVPEEKIKVIYLAAADTFRKKNTKEEIEKIKAKYQTGDKYILHTGTLNPRKNLEFLIKVFHEVIKELPNYNLVIAGKKGWYYEGLFELVSKLNLDKKVIFAGYIPDEDAPILYQGSSLFVFPSLYEGFGLPPLEAMSSGVPVVSSNTSSLPEVIGDGGILLSPQDKSAWIKAIKKILKDDNFRKKMSQKAIDQAQSFSWEKCAKETLAVYEGLK